MAKCRLAAAGLLVGLVALTACSANRGGSGSNDSGFPAPMAGGRGGTPERAGGAEVRTSDDPQSTFAVDVDTASYGYARRLVTEGRVPDRASVRPEEFVNAFPQGYREPAGDGFAVHADGARFPSTHEASGDLRLLRVGLQTRSEDNRQRKDANLTFVIDVSGSMAEPGRLDLVQDALHTLVDQLRATDEVAIVAYSDRARVVREMTRVSEKADLHRAIDDLRTESSTNLEAGLVLGYRVARDGFRSGATNRVILLSDGLANVGNTDADPILRQTREEAAKQIALLGVGVGSDYGDQLMERLADSGDGFVVYVSEREQARRIFVEQLPATLSVRALDAKVQVTFDPAAVEAYRLIGYENRAVADQDFRNNRVDGGEVGPGHSVTALYAVRVVRDARPSAEAAKVEVRWLDPRDRSADEAVASVTIAELGTDLAETARGLQVCYAAAYFAEVLRDSQFGREVRLEDLAVIAERSGERELATLIRRSADLGVARR
jgi:Ca-activated chloride channel family protein